MLLMSGAGIAVPGSVAAADGSAVFCEVRRTNSTAESVATVAPATIQGRARLRPPPDIERPQLGQKFPLASDPQVGHFMGEEDKPILAPMATEHGGRTKSTRFDPPLSDF